MPYLAQTLINKSWYLTGIVSRELQTVSGEQINEGLELLNFVIADKAYDKEFIPYFTEYLLTAVVGQEKYFIPNLVEIETFTFNINNVRFASYQVGRKEYFGDPRVDSIESLPFKWHVERTVGGSNLYLYFLPSDTFPLKIWGKFSFANATLSTDLLTVFDEYYVNYLKYETAAYIANEYCVPLQPQVASVLEAMRNKIRQQSPMDLTLTKKSRFGKDQGTMWGLVNLSRGWTVG